MSGTSNIIPEPPIFIAGTYRGRASLTTGLFAQGGAWIGSFFGGDSFNPDGYFENKGLKAVLHTMLEISGYNDSDNLPPENLIEYRDLSWLKFALENLLLADGYRGGPRVLKNLKIIFFWRYFEKIYPNAKWVVVRRDPKQVVRSMMRVNVLTLAPLVDPLTEERLERVVAGYNERLDAVKAGIDSTRWREVNSQRIVDGDLDQLESAMTWAGVRFDEKAVRNFLAR